MVQLARMTSRTTSPSLTSRETQAYELEAPGAEPGIEDSHVLRHVCSVGVSGTGISNSGRAMRGVAAMRGPTPGERRLIGQHKVIFIRHYNKDVSITLEARRRATRGAMAKEGVDNRDTCVFAIVG